MLKKQNFLKNLKSTLVKSTSTTADLNVTDSTRASKFKNYEQLPGPKPVFLIGNLWRYLPVIGDYRLDALHLNAFKNQSKYGDIVRESIIGQHSILHVFDPKDIKKVLKSIGKYPQRRSHRALMKYRLDRPEKYNSGGLFPENGLPWITLRKKLQKLFMNGRNIRQYVPQCDEITNELMNFLDHNLDENFEIDDFHTALFRWSLENTAVLALDLKLGALKHNLSNELELLIKSTHDTHSAVIETESSSDLWKKYRTKSYRKLETAQDNMYDILKKYFDKKIKNDSDIEHAKFSKDDQSIFTQLLSNAELDRKDLFMTIMDLFLAGLDTTSFTSGFAVYFLTQNQNAQTKLREEVGKILKKTNGQFNDELLNSIPYLKACVKETYRLQPVSIGIGRVTDQDLVLKEHNIPSGTMVILHNQVACRLEKNFKNANKFIPERWLENGKLSEKIDDEILGNELNNLSGAVDENWFIDKDQPTCPIQHTAESSKIDPFLCLPFGFGKRVCLGRAFSEMEIYILLAKLVYNYEINYDHEKIETITRLINVPNRPMRFKFKKIKHL